MSIIKKCSHGIDMLPHAECLECELIWHQNLVDTHTKALLRHHEEVKRLSARLGARTPATEKGAP